VRVAGQKYRVVSSASEEDLHRLAGIVSRKLGEVGSRAQPSHALLLAALALAYEADAERSRRAALEVRTRRFLEGLLRRIERVLDGDGLRPATKAPERFT